MALSKVLAPGRALTGCPAASVSVGCAIPSSGIGPVPISPFSDWKNTLTSLRYIVCHKGRNADAEIDEHPRMELPGDALGDDGLCVHCLYSLATR